MRGGKKLENVPLASVWLLRGLEDDKEKIQSKFL